MQELAATVPLTGRELIGEHGGVRSETAHWNGHPVFVKTLLVDDPDSQARFRHEGQVAGSVRMPLVVSPLATTPTQLLFPFVPGGTLRELLERQPLNVDQATEIAGAVLLAAVHLHEQGIVHHDLKPENVLLVGGRVAWDAVRVVDFGMSYSRALPLDIHSGTRMGTPHFMAPEQFRGARGDLRSDLYSVGVLLFDSLAGCPPYEDALGWLAGIHERCAPLPGPAALHPVLSAALSRDPECRPASAAQMKLMLCTARLALGLPLLDMSLGGLAESVCP